MQIYLIRHGEVEEKYHKVFGGSRIDMGLSPLGLKHGEAVAGEILAFCDEGMEALLGQLVATLAGSQQALRALALQAQLALDARLCAELAAPPGDPNDDLLKEMMGEPKK